MGRGWNQATLVTRRLELTPNLPSVRRSLQDHQVRQRAGRQAVWRGCGGHGRVQGWCAAPLNDAARLHLLSPDSTSLRPGMPLGRPMPRPTASWRSSAADPAASVSPCAADMAALEIEIFKVRHAPTSPKATQTIPLNLVVPNPGSRGSGPKALRGCFVRPRPVHSQRDTPFCGRSARRAGRRSSPSTTRR